MLVLSVDRPIAEPAHSGPFTPWALALRCPWTRCPLAARRVPALLPPPAPLRPARRVFTARCADCRLTTLEREVIGLEREDDVPGAQIPALYFDFLRSRRGPPPGRGVGPKRPPAPSRLAPLRRVGRAPPSRAPPRRP